MQACSHTRAGEGLTILGLHTFLSLFSQGSDKTVVDISPHNHVCGPSNKEGNEGKSSGFELLKADKARMHGSG
jgi:hypothetical protein